MKEQKLKDMIREVVAESHQAIAEVQSSSLAEIKKMNGIGRLPKFIKTDSGFLIALIIFITSIITPVFLIRQDIALLQNDLKNIVLNADGLTDEVKIIKDTQNKVAQRVSMIEGFLKSLGLKI